MSGALGQPVSESAGEGSGAANVFTVLPHAGDPGMHEILGRHVGQLVRRPLRVALLQKLRSGHDGFATSAFILTEQGRGGVGTTGVEPVAFE